MSIEPKLAERLLALRTERGLTQEEAAEKIRTGTRHFAKRQMTFLKREESIQYVRTDRDGAYEEICNILL